MQQRVTPSRHRGRKAHGARRPSTAINKQFFFLIKKRSSHLWRLTGLGSSILRACVAIHLLGLPDTPNSILSATLAPAPWHLLDCVAHTAEEQSLCSGLTCCKAFSCPGPTQSLQLFKSLGDQANITHPNEDYAASKT